MAYDLLKSECKIGSMTVKNRVVMTGIGVMTADPGCTAGVRETEYFKERAKGVSGLS